MNTTVKHISETKVELTVTLGEKELEAARLVALQKLSATAKVPGFRQGKVPVSVLEKNVDQGALNEEILDNALSRGVAEAFLSEDLQVLGRPEVAVKVYVPGENLEFTAEADVVPEVTLGDYKNLTASLEKVSVTDKEVDEIIERMQIGFAEKSSVDRAAKDGDDTVIDFVGKKDDVAFDGGTAKDYNLTLGSNQFIPGFEEAIVGHKKGETFDVPLKFPENYHAKELAGADVVFTVTLNDIKEAKLPELNDEFAAKAGPFTSVDELRDDIKRELTAQKEREAGEKLKEALVEELVSLSEVPIPEIVVDAQMESIEQDFTQNLLYQGLTIDQYLNTHSFKDIEAWREAEVRPVAVKRVQAALVLAQVAKDLKISATEEEIDQHVNLYKQSYQNNPEALKQFETPEVRNDIANRLITEKTVDELVRLNSKPATKASAKKAAPKK